MAGRGRAAVVVCTTLCVYVQEQREREMLERDEAGEGGRGVAGVKVRSKLIHSLFLLLSSFKSVDFSSWTAGKIFNVGDSLAFAYGPGHTVAEVNLEEYTSCTAGNSTDEHALGSTEIPLKTPGTHYFICAVTGHCAAGMKLAITVSIPGGSATTPTPPSGGLATPQMIYS